MTRAYVVYDNTGKILRAGSCPNRDVNLQAKTGEKVKEIPKGLKKLDLTHKIEIKGTPKEDTLMKLSYEL